MGEDATPGVKCVLDLLHDALTDARQAAQLGEVPGSTTQLADAALPVVVRSAALGHCRARGERRPSSPSGLEFALNTPALKTRKRASNPRQRGR